VLVAGLLLASLVIGGLLGIRRGQDTNFDQLRAHYYSIYWLLHSRANRDFFPAGEAGLLPDIWNVPWYFLVGTLSPRGTMAYLGASSAVAASLLAIFIWRLLDSTLSVVVRLAFVSICLVVGLSGPAFIGEFATTFGDIATAVPFLVGLLILLWTGRPSDSDLQTGVAFFFIGASTGLKATNAGWLVAALVAFFCCTPRGHHRFKRTAWAAAGAGVGIVISYGPWALMMWRRYRSPTFPLLNNIFHSPDYLARPFRDARWVAESPFDLIRLPFDWLSSSQVSSEVPMRDWRWAILLMAALCCLLVQLVRRGLQLRRLERRPPIESDLHLSAADQAPSRPMVVTRSTAIFVATLLGVGTLLTLIQLAYSRYLVIGELLSPIVFLVILDALALKLLSKLLVFAVIAATLLATTHVDSWGRADFAGSWFRVDTTAAPEDSVVFVIDRDPYQYLLPFFGASNRYVMLGDTDERFGVAYEALEREMLRSGRRSYLLSAASSADQLPDAVRRDLARYQLRLDPAACLPVASIRGPTWLCQLVRA